MATEQIAVVALTITSPGVHADPYAQAVGRA